MLPFLFPWKLQQIQGAQWQYLTEHILSCKIEVFSIVTTTSYAFLPACHACKKNRTSRDYPLFHCWNAPPTASQCPHPQFGLHKHSSSIDECHWLTLFSTSRNSVPHLCFIHTSMSDTIPSDCPSASNCCTVTTCNGVLVGAYTLYCHITNIHLWCHELTK